MLMSRARRGRSYAATALSGLLLLAGVEVIVRQYPRLMPPQWQIRYFTVHAAYEFTVVPDPEIGFLIPPNQHKPIRTVDYTSTLETDSKGFPNRDPWPQRATIVLLGDSLITGGGVSFAESFAQRIGRMLPDQALLNLGLGGAGPERENAVYRRFGVALQPRLVVACLYLAADFDNDLQYTTWLQEGHGTDFNAFRVNVPGSQGKWYTFPFERYLEQSWFYGMAKEAAYRWIQGSNDRYRFADGAETLLSRRTLEFAMSPADRNDPRIEALLASVEKLRNLVARQGGQVLVMLIPSKEALLGVPASAERLSITARTRQRLQEANFPLLDLYPTLKRAAAVQAPYFRDDIHLTTYGNYVVAQAFVDWFRHDDGMSRPSAPSIVAAAGARRHSGHHRSRASRHRLVT
jgi:hypothetical protein